MAKEPFLKGINIGPTTPSSGYPRLKGLNIRKEATNTPGLVGYWKLDEPYTQAQDSSGNGNHGTFSGTPMLVNSCPTITYDTNNKSLDFSGKSQYITMGAASSLGTGAFTITCWVYIKGEGTGNSPTGGRPIIGSLNGDQTSYGTGLKYYNGKIYGLFSNNNAYWWNTLQASVSLNTWYFVALTFDGLGASKNGNLYINNSLIASGTGTTGNYGYALQIGGSPAANNEGYFQGTIDDARIYNKVLSAGEMSDIYAGNTGLTDSTLSGWWKLNEKSYAEDATGYGNNGSWVAAPTPTSSVPSAITFPDPKALTFNGSSQYVNLGTNIAKTNYTISAWIKPASFPSTGGQSIVFSVDSAQSNNNAWGIYTNNSGLYVYASSGSGGQAALMDTTYNASSGNYPTTSWTHILVTVDGSNIKFYRNCNLINTVAQTVQMGGTAYGLSIGRYGAYNGYYFNGSIDDVRIYNRALTAGEISGLYAGSIQPLAGAWSVVRGNPSGVGANKYSVIKGSASALSSIQ